VRGLKLTRRWAVPAGALAGALALAAPALAVKPAVLLGGPGEGQTIASHDPSFQFSSTGTESFECTMDGSGPIDCGANTVVDAPVSKQFFGLGDGAHTFTVDAVGQVEPPIVVHFSVDTTGPNTTILSGPPKTTASASAIFAFASEAGTQFSCQLDSAQPQTCASPFGFNGLSDGAHTMRVFGKDALFNQGAAATFSWAVDTTPPARPAILRGPRPAIKRHSVTFDLAPTEAGARFECSLNRERFKPCTTVVGYVRLPNGGHVFRVRSVDQIGNASLTLQRPFFVDALPPGKPVVVTPRTAGRDFQVKWRSIDVGSGIDHYLVRFRVRSATTEGIARFRILERSTPLRSLTFTGQRGRTYCFQVTASDLAGNPSSPSPEACTTVR
jgi:hypothetical protein